MTVRVVPERVRIPALGQVRFAVEGGGKSSVTWSVDDSSGGVIDANGLYRAPHLPGVYEITARTAGEKSTTATAHVTVA